MIRLIVPQDTPALVALSANSGLFTPEESGAIVGILDEYHSTNALTTAIASSHGTKAAR